MGYSKREYNLSQTQAAAVYTNLDEATKLPSPEEEWIYPEVDHSLEFHKTASANSLIEKVRRRQDEPSQFVWRTKKATWEYMIEKSDEWNFELHNKGESRQ